MKYEDVLALITTENIKKWCELSVSFFKWNTWQNNIGIGKLKSFLKQDRFKHLDVILKFQSLIFEAWIGWNKKQQEKRNDDYVEMQRDFIQVVIGKYKEMFIVFDFESGRPLLPPVQALIAALARADELWEGKNEIL